jgi:hypothetical protein
MTMTTFKVPEDLSFKVTLIAEAWAAQVQSLKSKKGFTHQDIFASLHARADGKKVLPLKAKPW